MSAAITVTGDEGKDTTYRVHVPLGTLRARVATRILNGILEQVLEVGDEVADWQKRYRETHSTVLTREQASERADQLDARAKESSTEEERTTAADLRDSYLRRIERMGERDQIELPGEPTDQESQTVLISKCLAKFEDEAYALIALMVIPEQELYEAFNSPRLERRDALLKVLDRFVAETLNSVPALEVARLAAEGVTVFRDEVLEIGRALGNAMASWTEALPRTEDQEDSTGSETSSPTSSTPSTDKEATDGDPSESSSDSDTISSSHSATASPATASVT